MSEASEIRQALAANDLFYEAFRNGDAEEMAEIWSKTAPLLCIHPGGPPLHGRVEVLASWRGILVDPPPVTANGARATVIRGVAFVTCFEHIGENILSATNVFVWEGGAWALVHHQASPVQADALSEQGPEGPLH